MNKLSHVTSIFISTYCSLASMFLGKLITNITIQVWTTSNSKPLAELIVLLLAYTRKWRIVIVLGSWLTDQKKFIELIVE